MMGRFKNLLLFFIAISTIGLSHAQNYQLSGQPGIQTYVDECDAGGLKGEFCTCMGNVYKEYKSMRENPDHLSDDEYMYKYQKAEQEYLDTKKRCAQYAPYGFDFTIPENTALVMQVLAANQGQILTPEQSKTLVAINKPLGWEHRFQSQPEVNYMNGTFTYKGKNKDGEEFEYKEGSTVKKYIYGAGILQLWHEDFGLYILPADSLGNCQFVIGECVFNDGKQLQKVVTKFENGVWIRNLPEAALRRALEKVIYDTSGIPLYKFYQDKVSTTEWIRVDDLNPKN